MKIYCRYGVDFLARALLYFLYYLRRLLVAALSRLQICILATFQKSLGVGVCKCDKMIAGIWRRFDVGVLAEFRQQPGFVVDFQIDAVDEQDSVRLARIHGAPEYVEADEVIGGNPELFEDGAFYFVWRMVERELYFSQS